MTVYSPERDSLILAEELSRLDLEGKRCLDMGTGSGFLAEKMLEQGAEEVVAADLNPEAVEAAASRLEGFENFRTVRSDLFSQVSGLFDIAVFNPPYLPSEEKEIGDEEIWSGGEEGVEVLEKFLGEVESYLTEAGFCVFVASSLSRIEGLKDDYEVLRSEKIWFEELYVMKSK